LDFTHAFYNNFNRDFSPTAIKQNFANVYGDTAASIAGNIYKTTIDYFGWISGSPGSIILSQAIDAYNGTVISTVTVTDAIGSKPIGPQSDIYLNKCTLDVDTYTVGSSVFAGFDSDNQGLMLSAMEGLNSLTGQMAALSQCATWIRGGNDLYATTTYPMATNGDAGETGCSPLLSSADAMILCYSVFDMMS
jgi:hypothetical protein